MASDTKTNGLIYLIPSTIADDTNDKVITPQVLEVLKKTRFFLVENVRTARRFISSLKLGVDIEALDFQVLDKNTPENGIQSLLNPVFSGNDIGILSEAGCPGIADPGSLAIKFAHSKDLRVVPLVGPSSILLALMASGFNGQSFIFHGYVPIENKERESFIKHIELVAIKKKQTQIFMDTPYRNNKLFQDIVSTCNSSTYLCVAREITGSNEFIKSKPLSYWKNNAPELHKLPTIFLISSP